MKPDFYQNTYFERDQYIIFQDFVKAAGCSVSAIGSKAGQHPYKSYRLSKSIGLLAICTKGGSVAECVSVLQQTLFICL